MAFEVFQSVSQGLFFTVNVVFIPLSTFATAGRFYSIRLVDRKVGTEDWLALGALVCFLVFVATNFAALYYINGREPFELPLEEIEKVRKILFIGAFMFPWNQLCAKYSILFCYYRLFGLIAHFDRWIYAIGIGQLFYHVPTCIVMLSQCRPVENYNSPLVNDWCVTSFEAGVETLNSLIDFSMVVLAIFMIRHVPTNVYAKIKLGLLFSLGGLAGIIGFIKIGFAFSSSTNATNQMIIGVWITVQTGVSVICCSALTYKPLLTHIASVFHTLRSCHKTWN